MAKQKMTATLELRFQDGTSKKIKLDDVVVIRFSIKRRKSISFNESPQGRWNMSITEELLEKPLANNFLSVSKDVEYFKPVHFFLDGPVPIRVTWEHLDEGWDGQYEKGTNDTRLLRFTCTHFVDDQEDEIPNGSYCTRCPIDTPVETLRQFSDIILQACQKAEGRKGRLESLSWLNPDDIANLDKIREEMGLKKP